MLNGDVSPPLRTKNYWPLYVVSRTLGLGRRDPAVDVLSASGDQATSRATVYAVRGKDGALGILLVNKGEALAAEVSLSGRSCSTPERAEARRRAVRGGGRPRRPAGDAAPARR